jgi:hypothetical protein
MNSDARSCAEESATVKMNGWRPKKKALLSGQRECFYSGMMEFLKNSREWVRGVHSSLGINHGVDNHGSQK